MLICDVVRLRGLQNLYDDDKHEMRCCTWYSLGQRCQIATQIVP